MPSVSSSSSPKVLLSSTVMTPSLPTLSMASAMSSPMAGSAAEIDAVAAICSLVSTSLAVESRYSVTDSTAFSRSEEHTSELQSRQYIVCRLLLEKKKNTHGPTMYLHTQQASAQRR